MGLAGSKESDPISSTYMKQKKEVGPIYKTPILPTPSDVLPSSRLHP